MHALEPKRVHPLTVAPVVLATGFVGAAATLDTEAGTTFCVFRICTGGYCPGCGGSRAVAALIKGDLAGSWAIHPWVPLILGQLLVLLAIWLFAGGDIIRRLFVPVLSFNVVLGLTIWGLRLAAGTIPAP